MTKLLVIHAYCLKTSFETIFDQKKILNKTVCTHLMGGLIPKCRNQDKNHRKSLQTHINTDMYMFTLITHWGTQVYRCLSLERKFNFFFPLGMLTCDQC
jgi:hypothetical protein